MTNLLLGNTKYILIAAALLVSMYAMNHYIKLRIDRVVSDIRTEQEALTREAISKADKFRKEIELLEEIELEKNKQLETQNIDEFVDRIESSDNSNKTPASDFMKETIRKLQRGTE